MKVVCIKDNWFKHKITPTVFPKIGEVYTVIDCRMNENGPGYSFNEIPLKQSGVNQWWGVEKFTPFDDYKKEELEKELKSIPCLILVPGAV